MPNDEPNVCEFCRASNKPGEDVCFNCGGPLGVPPGGEEAPIPAIRRRAAPTGRQRWTDVVYLVFAVAVGAVGVWMLFRVRSTGGLVLEGGLGAIVLLLAIAAIAVGAYGVRGFVRDRRRRRS